MTPATLFPLSTKRSDDTQGIWSRQVPQILAAGSDAIEAHSFFAERGGRVAHVLMTGTPGWTLLRSERPGARTCVRGDIEVLAESVSLVLEVQLERDGEVSESRMVAEGLRDLVNQAAVWLSDTLGTTCTPEMPATEAATREWLSHLDNNVIYQRSGVSAFSSATVMVEPLAALLQIDAVFAPAAVAAESLIVALQDAHPLASLKLATAVARDRDSLARVLALAEKIGDDAVVERVHRDLAEHGPADKVALGEYLIRTGRAADAVHVLREITDLANAEIETRALAFLGVALAATGDVAEATKLWRSVVERGDDETAVRVATKNLQRVPGE